ncbi:MAG: DUF3892 domain-containing protein [Ignavibacteria bacterium]|nr:DUF3892 domain-containing protein [Ignavibacteria bacterium]
MNIEREAEKYIFAKSNENDTHILWVRAVDSIKELNLSGMDCENGVDTFGDLYSKDEIIKMIREDLLICTAYIDKQSGNWKEGNEVSIYADKFIRSDKDRTESDNLGELCDFDLFS